MKKLYKILLLLIFINSNLLAKSVMIGVDMGGANLTYSETFEADASLNKVIPESAITLNLHTQVALFTRWIYLKANVRLFALPFEYAGASFFSQINQQASISLVLPSRPFNVTLVAEQFYTQMVPSNKGFGYTTLNGFHFYPYADYTTRGGITFFIKYPLLSFLANRSEMTGGIDFRFGNGANSYPEVLYAKSYVLKLRYSKVSLTFEEAVGDVIVVTEEISATLGMNF